VTKVDALKAANEAIFFKHGPGLRYDYSVWIEARDPAEGRVLLGGLGGMGCGIMWVDEEEGHKKYPGYADAPICSSRGSGR